MDKISMLTLGAALALSGKESETRIAEALGDFENGITLKGSVSYYKDLPAGAKTGDEYIVLYTGAGGTNEDGTKYVWDGEGWRKNGAALRLYRDKDGDLCEED